MLSRFMLSKRKITIIWIAIALALPVTLGFAFDNGLPYALVDHANRPVEDRSILWTDAKVEPLAFVSRFGRQVLM